MNTLLVALFVKSSSLDQYGLFSLAYLVTTHPLLGALKRPPLFPLRRLYGCGAIMPEPPHHLPQHVSSKQAAHVLGIPEGTLRYWRCIGSGPAWVKLGRRTLYSVDDLVEFIARGRRNPSVRTMEVDDVSL